MAVGWLEFAHTQHNVMHGGQGLTVAFFEAPGSFLGRLGADGGTGEPALGLGGGPASAPVGVMGAPSVTFSK